MRKPVNRMPTFIDLFSGCGGLSLGFLQAGYRCLLAVDKNPRSVHCYNLNLKGDNDAGAIRFDLSELQSREEVSQFLGSHGIKSGACDVLVGGPPCQSFSVVGRNKTRALMKAGGNIGAYWKEKNARRASLFNTYALFLEVLAPRWFLFENVPSIRSHEQFECLRERFSLLHYDENRPLDYKTVPDIYLASRYGVPQDRRRFVLVGYRVEDGIEKWIKPEEKPAVSVAEALDDLPEVLHGHGERVISRSINPLTLYQRLMSNQNSAGVNDGVIYDHVCRWHNPDDIALFERMKPGARFADPDVQRALREINPRHKLIKYATDKFKDKLHKLDPDRPAWTVTAHLQKDCYKFIHHRQPRTISVREAARLQSFPDWFKFDGLSMITSFGQIGNAVPPLLAQAFAESFYSADSFLCNDNQTLINCLS